MRGPCFNFMSLAGTSAGTKSLKIGLFFAKSLLNFTLILSLVM